MVSWDSGSPRDGIRKLLGIKGSFKIGDLAFGVKIWCLISNVWHRVIYAIRDKIKLGNGLVVHVHRVKGFGYSVGFSKILPFQVVFPEVNAKVILQSTNTRILCRFLVRLGLPKLFKISVAPVVVCGSHVGVGFLSKPKEVALPPFKLALSKFNVALVYNRQVLRYLRELAFFHSDAFFDIVSKNVERFSYVFGASLLKHLGDLVAHFGMEFLKGYPLEAVDKLLRSLEPLPLYVDSIVWSLLIYVIGPLNGLKKTGICPKIVSKVVFACLGTPLINYNFRKEFGLFHHRFDCTCQTFDVGHFRRTLHFEFSFYPVKSRICWDKKIDVKEKYHLEVRFKCWRAFFSSFDEAAKAYKRYEVYLKIHNLVDVDYRWVADVKKQEFVIEFKEYITYSGYQGRRPDSPVSVGYHGWDTDLVDPEFGFPIESYSDIV